MNNGKTINPTIIVIFGATGDLAKRKLFPAFQNLFLDGRLPEKFQIIALGRAEKTQEEFSSYVIENLNNFSRKPADSDPDTQKFISHITYLRHDIDKEESYRELDSKLNSIDQGFGVRSNRLFYLYCTFFYIYYISIYEENWPYGEC